MRKRILFINIIVLSLTLTGCYAHGPWRGKVIDSETKQPIEGAAVVAEWSREFAGLGAGSITRFYHAEETKTDENGNFEIPSLQALDVHLLRDIKGPVIVIYKPGYMSFPWYQTTPKKIPDSFFLNEGAVVELPKAKNEKEQRDSAEAAYQSIFSKETRDKAIYFQELLRK